MAVVGKKRSTGFQSQVSEGLKGRETAGRFGPWFVVAELLWPMEPGELLAVLMNLHLSALKLI